MVEEGTKKSLESIVLTFANHPRSILQNDNSLKLLSTNEEKKVLIEKLGVNHLIIHPFDKSFSELTGEEFVKNILVDKLHIGKIIIGHDHRFGKNRASDYNDLAAFGKKYGFEVEQISAQEIHEISISSTKIRQALTHNQIALANQYLGRPYSFSGKVVLGKQLGRTIDFPTANLQIEDSFKLLPNNGVYAVKGNWDGKNHNGMMNIGTRPTLEGTTVSFEVHFFNLNEDLYDKTIEIEVYEFLREEKKFESFNHLKEQLGKDKDFCLNYFNP